MASSVLWSLLAVLFCIVRFSNAFTIGDSLPLTKPIRKALSQDSSSIDVLQKHSIVNEKKPLQLLEEATKHFVDQLKNLYQSAGSELHETYKEILLEELYEIFCKLSEKSVGEVFEDLLRWYFKEVVKFVEFAGELMEERLEDQIPTRRLKGKDKLAYKKIQKLILDLSQDVLGHQDVHKFGYHILLQEIENHVDD